MKVCIITFHFPYNCGAILQCLALQTAIIETGNSASVINYRPWYHQNRYTPFKNPLYFARKVSRKRTSSEKVFFQAKRFLGGFCRTVLSWLKALPKIKRDVKFKQFRRAFLNETKTYRSIRALQKNPPVGNVYFTGSDQVWNISLTENIMDPAYFLDFGGSAIKRFSYSAGANFSGLLEPVETLSKYLNRFSAISLREELSRQLIEDIVRNDIPIHIDVDPTLLLTSDQYSNYICKCPLYKEPFIFVYTMPNNSQKEVFRAAQILSEKTGLHVIEANGNPALKLSREFIADRRFCGPSEFLWYVQHASYVLTNSYHGSVFSIIFQKQFATIPHTITGNRVIELLERIALSARCCSSVNEAVRVIQTNIDYNSAYEKLALLREASLDYLWSCICTNKEGRLDNQCIQRF